MKTFPITYVKAHFSSLIRAASEGESFVISVAGQPTVRVRPLTEDEVRASEAAEATPPDPAQTR